MLDTSNEFIGDGGKASELLCEVFLPIIDEENPRKWHNTPNILARTLRSTLSLDSSRMTSNKTGEKEEKEDVNNENDKNDDFWYILRLRLCEESKILPIHL